MWPGCAPPAPASCSAVTALPKVPPPAVRSPPGLPLLRALLPAVPPPPTHPSQSFGTASYAAPELLTEGKLTKSADIFSLAIVAWELSAAAAAGAAQELHPGMTAMQVIMQVSQHQLRPEVPAGCPPQLADLMRRCWSQDPALRCVAAPAGAASWQCVSKLAHLRPLFRQAAQLESQVSHLRLSLCTPRPQHTAQHTPHSEQGLHLCKEGPSNNAPYP